MVIVKHSVIVLLGMLSLSIVAVSIVAVLCSSSTPLVTAKASKQIESADSIPVLLQHLQHSYQRAYLPQKIQFNKQQLSSLSGFIQRANPAINITPKLQPHLAWWKATLTLPNNPFGNYINIRFGIKEGKTLQFTDVTIGRLSIPGSWFKSLLEWQGNRYFGKPIVSQFIERIDDIEITPQWLTFSVRPVHDLLIQLRTLKRPLSSQQALFQQKVEYYLKFLKEFKVVDIHLPTAYVKQYLQGLFSEAIKQSATPLQAAEQNKAALLALAIYDGSRHFAKFAGNIDRHLVNTAQSDHLLLLAGRRDLCQHFIYSAAIEILSQQGFSSAVGEFKELMDRSNKGSGFSFIDLSADMAGVKLATFATNPIWAGKIQQRMASMQRETLFFPSITELPEGLHKNKFAQQIGAVDSPEYNELKAVIKQRIDNLPLYQSSQVEQ